MKYFSNLRALPALLAGLSFLALPPVQAEDKAAPVEITVTQADAAAQAQAYIAEQIKAGKINKDQKDWRTRLPKFKTLEFEAGKKYYWALKTSKGDIKIRLMPEVAPEHVSNFIYLTELEYFDGLIFHRVIKGFMAQGGCPLGRGNGGPGYKFGGELKRDVKHDKPGILSMAHAGKGTDGSQFFITFAATPWLDMQHTVFGEVVEGLENVKKLEAQGSRSGKTRENLTLDQARIIIE